MMKFFKSLFEKKEKSEAKKYAVTKGLSPKELATKNKEPWCEVIKTHINVQNPKNGFFELDWNEYFVEMLRQNGYQGNTDEDVINQWFTSLCKEIGEEEDVSMYRRYSGLVENAIFGPGDKF